MLYIHKTYRVVGFLKCENFVSVKSDDNVIISFVDENFKFISSSYYENPKDIEIPTDAKYCKLSFMKGVVEHPNLNITTEINIGNKFHTKEIELSKFDFILYDNNSIKFSFYDKDKKEIKEKPELSYDYKSNIGQISKHDIKRIYPDAEYVKFTLKIVDENTKPMINIIKTLDVKPSKVKYSSECDLEIVKDNYKSNRTYSPVYHTKVNNQSDNEKYYSRLLIKLPKNYTQNGTPVPLVLFKTGFEGFKSIKTNKFNYQPYIQYLVDCGFAVFDFHCGTSKYPTCGNGMGLPTNLMAAKSAYKYIINHFNVKQDELFLACKSVGGDIISLLAYSDLPVKAIGMFSPALDPIRYCFGYGNKTKGMFADEFGLDDNWRETLFKSINYTDKKFQSLVIKHLDKISNHLPFQRGVKNKDIKDMLFLDVKSLSDWSDIEKTIPAPVKIWSATDDSVTPFQMHKNFINMLKNGNCEAELREMPAGTGGHQTTNSDHESIQVTNVTTKLGVRYDSMNVAWVELVDWFTQHMNNE